jgi:hypothetical protein
MLATLLVTPRTPRVERHVHWDAMTGADVAAVAQERLDGGSEVFKVSDYIG